jgi:hypothetical protein
MSARKRFVFDTNVLVSATLSGNSLPDRAVRLAAKQGDFCFSAYTFSELRRVFTEDKFDRYISLARRLAFIEALLANAVFVVPGQVPAVCRDADDNQLLAVATTCGADCLCSGDDDLLSLATFESIPILSPARFVEQFAVKKK